MRLIILVLLLPLCTAAQKTGQALADSLTGELRHAANDTARARLYNRIFSELVLINTDAALQTARTGFAHVQQMKWEKGIAVFRSNLGQVHSDRGNYDSAIFYYKEALRFHTAAGDKVNMASVCNNMGSAAQNIRSDYAAAADWFFRGLQYAEEAKDDNLASICLDNISRLYSLQLNSEKALAYALRALETSSRTGNLSRMAATQQSIGNIYFDTKRTDSAQACYRRAALLFEQADNKTGLAGALGNLALTFGSDYRSTIETRLRAQQLHNEVNPLHLNAITNTGNLGIAYFDVVRYGNGDLLKQGGVIPADRNVLLRKAEENLKNAILFCEQSGESDTRATFLGNLAELQAFRGDYKNAYFSFRSYRELTDTLYSQESKNRIAAAESRQEIERRDNELRLKQLSISSQRKILWATSAAAVLLAFIGFLLYRQGRMRKKTNAALQQLNASLEAANRVKTKFFGILSHDLRSPIARLVSLMQLQETAPELLSSGQEAAHRQRIAGAATSLLENMESLLLWSKGQMEQFAPVKRPTDAAGLFAYIQNAFRSVDNIGFSFSGAAGWTVNTDTEYLQTIMQNLTANAVNAIGSGSGSIAWKAGFENGKHSLVITNSGPGISPELAEQLNQGTTPVRSGLGIHIIHDLAKAIGCRVTIQAVEAGTSAAVLFGE